MNPDFLTYLAKLEEGVMQLLDKVPVDLIPETAHTARMRWRDAFRMVRTADELWGKELEGMSGQKACDDCGASEFSLRHCEGCVRSLLVKAEE